MAKLIFSLGLCFLLFSSTFATETNTDPIPAAYNRISPPLPYPINENETELYLSKIVYLTKIAWASYFPFPEDTDPLKTDELINSLPTLWMFNLTNEYNRTRDWIVQSNFSQLLHPYSHFGNTVVASLLSTYSLTNDTQLLDAALRLAKMTEKFWESLNEPSLEFLTQKFIYQKLEFTYLSNRTGDLKYTNRVNTVGKYLDPRVTTYQHLKTGFASEWLLTKLKAHYQSAEFGAAGIKNIPEQLEQMTKSILQSKLLNLTYYDSFRNDLFPEENPTSREAMMLLQDCRLPTVFLMASKLAKELNVNETVAKSWMLLANRLLYTCYNVTLRVPAQLPMVFLDIDHAGGQNASKPVFYQLTSELIEAYFFFWRITGDEVFRQMGWEFSEALLNTAFDEKYVSFRWVAPSGEHVHDPAQGSVFAGTLRYVYLLFMPPPYLPLEKWIFNADGAPFPRLFTF